MKYRRLPGKKRGFGSWRTLWMGDDHLLAVNSNGYAEEYTRYYYKDIKAVIVRRTSARGVWNGVLAAALGVSILPLFAFVVYGTYPPGTLASVCFTAPLLLTLLLVNTLRGPCCRCHILMPLGASELPTLRRVRTARRILELLRPQITERQGTMAETDAVARTLSPPGEPVSPASSPLPAESTLGEAIPRTESLPAGYDRFSPCRGSAHYASFSLLIAQAFFGFATLKFHGMPFLSVYGILTLGLFLCLVTAVVKQHSRPVPRLSGRLVWAALLALACAIFLAYYVGMFLHAAKWKGSAKPEMDVPGIVSTLVSHPYFPYGIVCFSFFGAIAGGLGLVSYLRGKGLSPCTGRTGRASLPRDVSL